VHRRSWRAAFAAAAALVTIVASAADAQTDAEARIRGHVNVLAGEIGERNVAHPEALQRAADYVAGELRRAGYEVATQEYDVAGVRCANLTAEQRGSSAPGEIIVVGAHYDSAPGSPGANDNASGVAAVLELARRFAARDTERTVRFVAFVNEEPPYFETPFMGSAVYARAARERGDDVRGMLSLETIGYYSDEPGSQHYPAPFSLFYPDRGNFVGFVSNFGSRGLMTRAVDAFRAASDFPVEHVATFAWVTGVGWSDHAAFWDAGYEALMVTDTAPFRYPYYHTSRDLPGALDYARLARVTAGLENVVAELSRAAR
jgi:hypothetical protein